MKRFAIIAAIASVLLLLAGAYAVQRWSSGHAIVVDESRLIGGMTFVVEAKQGDVLTLRRVDLPAGVRYDAIEVRPSHALDARVGDCFQSVIDGNAKRLAPVPCPTP